MRQAGWPIAYAVCAASQPTLTKCGMLLPTLAQVKEDCGTLNRYGSKPATETDFGIVITQAAYVTRPIQLLQDCDRGTYLGMDG